jgi:hypothetical protein
MTASALQLAGFAPTRNELAHTWEAWFMSLAPAERDQVILDLTGAGRGEARNVVGTVSWDQVELLQTALRFYGNGATSFELDACFGLGAFYADGRLPKPRFRFDVEPRAPGVVQADCRDLSLLPTSSIGTSLLDPPFIHHAGAGSKMGQLYRSYHNQIELHAMYAAAAKEQARVIPPGGLLVWKCQDIVEAGRQVFSHLHVWDYTTRAGFECVEDLILVKQQRIIGHNHQEQQHARKTHSHFLCFVRI